MEIKVQITYDVSTPESDEHGGTADHGFCGPGGWKYSIADDDFRERVKLVGGHQALVDMTPAPQVFESIADAVAFIKCDGPFESCGEWLTQTSPSCDIAYYELGEDTRLSYHIEAPAAIKAQIIKELS